MPEYFTATVFPFLLSLGISIIKVILIWVVGNYIIKFGIKILENILNKAKLEATIKKFIINLSRVVLKVLLLVAIVQELGVETASIVALVGGFSLAIGLAFQGALSNFAGGLLILLFKPFKVGDFVDISGSIGFVEEIEMVSTKIRTPDNKIIIVPNGTTANSTLTNYSAKSIRRVDFSFGVAYESDLKQVKETLLEVVNAHDKVLKDPAPFVRLGEQADSSLNYTVRLWAKTSDYWDVHFDIIENVTDAFNEKGISIPYPQLDLHQK